MPKTVRELGEAGVIDLVQRTFPEHPRSLVGIGDDAAVLPPGKKPWVVTTDTQVEGTHFHRRWTSAFDLGHKSLAVNLSDLVAMGAKPYAGVLSLILPGDLKVPALGDMLKGMATLAATEPLHLVGGNVAQGSELSLTWTVWGHPTGKPWFRARMKTGDAIFLTGTPGLSHLGWKMFEADQPGASAKTGFAKKTRMGKGPRGACRHRFLRPTPRTGLIKPLRRFEPTAVMDTSDGLSKDLPQFAKGCRVELDADALFGYASVKSVAGQLGLSSEAVILGGGEDYELLFAVSAEKAKLLSKSSHLGSVPIRQIGIVTPGKPGLFLRRNQKLAPFPKTPLFRHF